MSGHKKLVDEFTLMQKMFLLYLERMIMEVTTERSLQKIFKGMEREFDVLSKVWDRLMNQRREHNYSTEMIPDDIKKQQEDISNRIDKSIEGFKEMCVKRQGRE